MTDCILYKVIHIPSVSHQIHSKCGRRYVIYNVHCTDYIPQKIYIHVRSESLQGQETDTDGYLKMASEGKYCVSKK